MKKQKCCICKKEFTGYGNNPYPIKTKGRCCDLCDMQVIKARLLGIANPKQYEIAMKENK